jgi:hypothetical protein
VSRNRSGATQRVNPLSSDSEHIISGMKTKREWGACPRCKQPVYFIKSHHCPEKIQSYIDAELDAFVDFETYNLDQDIEDFWNEPAVKFEQWCLKNGRK